MSLCRGINADLHNLRIPSQKSTRSIQKSMPFYFVIYNKGIATNENKYKYFSCVRKKVIWYNL